MKYKYFIVVLSLLLLINFSSAVGCDAQGWKGYAKLYGNKTVSITCTTCNYINITTINPSGIKVVDDQTMVKSGSTFTYTFVNLSDKGLYSTDGYSNLDEPLAFCFETNLTGKEITATPYVILLLIIILSLVLLIWINRVFNVSSRDSMYRRIVQNYYSLKSGYGKGNFGSMVLTGLSYGLLRNLFVFYYLLVVIFSFVLTEFVDAFNVTSLVLLFTTITNVLLWGFILVFIVFIFEFYEIIRAVLSDVTKMMLGISNGK